MSERRERRNPGLVRAIGMRNQRERHAMFGLTDPEPGQGLIVHNADPLNAEPPLHRLRADFLTRAGVFYVRCHGDVPRIDPERHRVTVTGLVSTPLALSVAELQARFEHRTVMAVMQCAGNRRADLQQVRPTSGDPWDAGAIGHAAWTGVPLAAALRAAGAHSGDDLHVAFVAVDVARNEGAPDAPYGVSIAMSKALDEDVLLAWAMNGEPLAPEHGAPLRVVAPGLAGVRSPKWLRAITVQDRPSDAVQQAGEYLMFPPDMRDDLKEPDRGFAITAMPLTSAICDPAAGATLAAGTLRLRGYAVATGRAVKRVDVSGNGGRDWKQATLEQHAGGRWSWTLWHAELTLAEGEHELAVRAWDDAGQTQPALPDDTWNCKGYLSAAWHRVRVRVA